MPPEITSPPNLDALADDRRELAARFAPLAYRVLGVFLSRNPAGHGDIARHLGPDEPESLALAALCRAAICYDQARGVKFITYAWQSIYLVLTRAARELLIPKHAAARAVNSLDALDGFAANAIPARASGPAAIAEQREEAARVLACCGGGRHAEVLWRHHACGEGLHEIADALGVTRQLMSQRLLRAKAAAREKLGVITPEEAARARRSATGGQGRDERERARRRRARKKAEALAARGRARA